MIQPSDLRRNNIVDIIDRRKEIHLPMGVRFKIIEILAFHVTGIFEHETIIGTSEWHKIDIKDLSPIPLTPKELYKLGFERNCSFFTKDSWPCQAILQQYLYGRTSYLLVDYEDAGVISGEFLYLHELQNIYHSLWKEELIN